MSLMFAMYANTTEQKNLMLVANKEEKDLLQLCQQIGYGEVICHVTDGQIGLEEAMIKK